jgi:hypothetical protein
MRFFVKKSQKDKKSGLYLSDFYTVYTSKNMVNLTPFSFLRGALYTGAGGHGARHGGEPSRPSL